MYQKIRIVVASFALIILCTLNSTTTLSFFTDTDSKLNNFTIGNASTSLVIYDNVSSETPRVLDSTNYPPLEETKEIPFYLEAINDGNIPVFQRFRVVVPIELKDTLTLSSLPDCTLSETETSCSNDDYTVVYNPSVKVDNVPTYAEYYITSNNVLNVGEKTVKWPTSKFTVGNLSNFSENLYRCADDSNNNCMLGINVYSDSVQTTGFVNALTAFTNLEETY